MFSILLKDAIISKTNFKYYQNGNVSESNRAFLECEGDSLFFRDTSPSIDFIIPGIKVDDDVIKKNREERRRNVQYKKETKLYNKKGNILSETIFDKKGELASKKTFKYHPNNELKEEIFFRV